VFDKLPLSAVRGIRRIGAIGDIHGEDQHLETALEFLHGSDVDVVLAVGDIVDGRGDINRCCELLQTHNVLTVKGNHERCLFAGEMRDLPEATAIEEIDAANLDFLFSLPTTRTFKTQFGPLMLCHGLSEYDVAGVWPGDYGYALESNLALLRLTLEARFRFVVNGHTHSRMVREFGNLTIVNAGALVHDHNPCFLTLDFEAGVAEYFNLGGSGTVLRGEEIKLPQPLEGQEGLGTTVNLP